MKIRLPGLLLPLVLALPLLGCKQGIGERCQLDSDCDSNHCVLPTGGSAQQGGTCQPTATDDASTSPADLATTPTVDMAMTPADIAMSTTDMAMTPTADMAMTPAADMAQVVDGGNGG